MTLYPLQSWTDLPPPLPPPHVWSTCRWLENVFKSRHAVCKFYCQIFRLFCLFLSFFRSCSWWTACRSLFVFVLFASASCPVNASGCMCWPAFWAHLAHSFVRGSTEVGKPFLLSRRKFKLLQLCSPLMSRRKLSQLSGSRPRLVYAELSTKHWRGKNLQRSGTKGACTVTTRMILH